MFNIKNDDKIKASNREKNPASIDKGEVIQKDTINDINEERLVQNLKNYIDCNVDSTEYDEEMKK